MKRLKFWTGIVLVFVCGLGIGGLGTAHYLRTHVAHFMRGGPEKAGEVIVKELTRGFALTDEQIADIETITGETRDELHERGRHVKREIAEIIARHVGRMREVLNEDQREEFDKRAEKMRLKHERFLEKLQG